MAEDLRILDEVPLLDQSLPVTCGVSTMGGRGGKPETNEVCPVDAAGEALRGHEVRIHLISAMFVTVSQTRAFNAAC